MNIHEALRTSTSTKRETVLLVNPSLGTKTYERTDKFRNYLSLGTLASALQDPLFLEELAKRSGSSVSRRCGDRNDLPFCVKIINLSLKPVGFTIREYMEAFVAKEGINPIVIGATATSAQLREAGEVAASAREIFPEALRVIGGPHVSVLPSAYLETTQYQVAVIGEGVETLADIVLEVLSKDPDLAKIPGIAFKDAGGKVRLTSKRKFLLDLDEYPFPSRSLGLFVDDLDDTQKNQNEIAYIFVGLGCPFNCTFCAQRAIHGGNIRERSADNVFAEIEELHGKGFRKFAVVQESFFNHKSRVVRFCDLIEKSGLEIEWTAETRADQIDFPGLKRMKAAGLSFVQIGLESGDQRVVNAMGKKIRLEQVIDLIEWCRGLEINTALYVLVGLPRQGWQSILKTALFLKDHTPYNRGTMHLSVSVAIPYPGTALAEEGGIRILRRPGETSDFPWRNPEVKVTEDGRFLGENFTETDDMTSEEIFEAMLYLDDFGHFLLHSLYNPACNEKERARALDFSHRMFYMIERRAMRDLIVRAQPDLTPENRKLAYLAILEKDEGREAHFKDVTESPEQHARTLTEFIATTRFVNGFHIMLCLSMPNRIKWMKFCAIIWALAGKNRSGFRFESDDPILGRRVDTLMDKLDAPRLNRLLELLDRDLFSLEFFEGFVESQHGIRGFGLDFQFENDFIAIAASDVAPTPPRYGP